MVAIAPSILASDWTKLTEEVRAVEAAGADMLHLDVMDGSFVPSITFGGDFVKAVRRVATKPLDVHLMIVQPENHVAAFADAGASFITVHVEACPHLHRTVQRIHEHGCKAGVAINPGTPVNTLHDIVHDADLILVMSVNPGWGGQAFIPHACEKLREARALVESTGRRGVLLEVDGGITDRTARQVIEAGAEVLVAGSHVFHSASYADAISSLRKPASV